MKEDLSNPHDAEVAAVRRYIANQSVCRRVQLLSYFDPAIVSIACLEGILYCTATTVNVTMPKTVDFTEHFVPVSTTNTV